jgi:hypothetical protein
MKSLYRFLISAAIVNKVSFRVAIVFLNIAKATQRNEDFYEMREDMKISQLHLLQNAVPTWSTNSAAAQLLVKIKHVIPLTANLAVNVHLMNMTMVPHALQEKIATVLLMVNRSRYG